MRARARVCVCVCVCVCKKESIKRYWNLFHFFVFYSNLVSKGYSNIKILNFHFLVVYEENEMTLWKHRF